MNGFTRRVNGFTRRVNGFTRRVNLAACVLALAGCAEKRPDDERRTLRDGARVFCVGPLAGSRVGSRRPVVRWRAEGEPREVWVEFCADRACERVIERVAAAGGTAAPTGALPYGPVFWRVRDPTREGSVSAAWWVSVPRGAREAPSGYAWRQRTSVDVDGDGIDDPIDPSGVVRRGPAAGVRIPRGDTSFHDGGDLDGDGYPEVVTTLNVGETLRAYRTPFVAGETPRGRVLEGETIDAGFSEHIVAGDFDGDGYGDLAVGAPQWEQNRGIIRVHRGGAMVGETLPVERVIQSPLGIGQRFTAVAAGDLDGDGADDLLAGAWGDQDTPGWGFVFGRDGAGFFPRWSTRGSVGIYLGFNGLLLDVLGDARREVVLSAGRARQTQGCVRVFEGVTEGRDIDVAAACPDATEGTRGFGNVLDAADLDGDGYVDLVATTSEQTQRLYVQPGGPSLAREAGMYVRSVPVTGRMDRKFSVGDFDGDGYGDVAVYVETPDGLRAYWYRGGAGGLSTDSEALR